MSGEVFIVGVGMTPFGRWPDRPLKSLVAEAVRAALKDAGTDVSTIGAAYFANSTQGHLDGQHMIRGQIALRVKVRVRERLLGLWPRGRLEDENPAEQRQRPRLEVAAILILRGLRLPA